MRFVRLFVGHCDGTTWLPTKGCLPVSDTGIDERTGRMTDLAQPYWPQLMTWQYWFGEGIGVAVVQRETKDVLRRRLVMFTTAITFLAAMNIGLLLFSSRSRTPLGIAATGIVSLVLVAAVHYAAARSS